MGDDAVSIYQAHIDALSDALLRRDHHAFSGQMSFPHTMILYDQAVVTPDAETSFHNLTEYAMTFQSQRVTEFIRLCSGAHFVTPTRIEGTHVSHMLSGATRLSAPYANRVAVGTDQRGVAGNSRLQRNSPRQRAELTARSK